MVDLAQIKEHMEVVGSDGEHVGTVDHIEGDTRIKLTKSDPTSGGEHHYLPASLITSVEGDRLRLSCPAAEARADRDKEIPAGESTS